MDPSVFLIGKPCPLCGETVDSVSSGVAGGVDGAEVTLSFGHNRPGQQKACRFVPGDAVVDEKLQALALGELGRAMKRWGIRPDQLKSPYRELMAFTPVASPSPLDLARLSLGDPCPKCDRPIDAIKFDAAAGIMTAHHHRGDPATCDLLPREPQP